MYKYHLFVVNKYFESLLKMWATILFEIDFTIISKITNDIDMCKIINETVDLLKLKYINENILIQCIKIRYIYEIINIYMFDNSDIYLFFNLTNQIKITDSITNLNKIKCLDFLFPEITIQPLVYNITDDVDIDKTIQYINDIKLTMGYPTISQFYAKFYLMKQKIFEKSWNYIFNPV